MMKKRRKRKVERKKFKVKGNSSIGILPVLSVVALLALFSETVRTLPAGALIGENFFNLPYEVPRLNSEIIEKKLLEKSDYRRIHKEIIFKKTSKKKRKIEKIEQDIQNIQTQISKVQTEISEIESKKREQEKEIVIAKIHIVISKFNALLSKSILGIRSFVLVLVPRKRLGTRANTKLLMPKICFSR